VDELSVDMQMSSPRELRVIQRPLARPATQDHDQSDISAGWSVALLPFHVSGGFSTAYVPIQSSDGVPNGIARIDLATGAETLLVDGFYEYLIAVANVGS
jgi:hypothetical protein